MTIFVSVGIGQVHPPHESHPLTVSSALYHDDVEDNNDDDDEGYHDESHPLTMSSAHHSLS